MGEVFKFPSALSEVKKPSELEKKGRAKSVEQTCRKLSKDRIAGPILQEEALKYLKEDGGFYGSYSGEIAPNGYLYWDNGTISPFTPVKVIDGMIGAQEVVLEKVVARLRGERP